MGGNDKQTSLAFYSNAYNCKKFYKVHAPDQLYMSSYKSVLNLFFFVIDVQQNKLERFLQARVFSQVQQDHVIAQRVYHS